MWWRKRDADPARMRYGVFVHAKNLILTDSAGMKRVGGAYTWRYVTATDPETAAQAAIKSLLNTPAFINELHNPEDALAHVTVEKIVPVQRRDRRRGTGVVFYIDTEEAM